MSAGSKLVGLVKVWMLLAASRGEVAVTFGSLHAEPGDLCYQLSPCPF